MAAAGRGFTTHNVSMTLPFEPVPKGRPRFKVMCNHVQAFTPPKTKAFENSVGYYYKGASNSYMFEQGVPITVSIEFGMAVPASYSKKRRGEMLDGVILHTVKPDVDNLVKAILDGLNGIAFHDDAQITALHVSKRYVQSPHIYINIHETL